MYHVTILHQVKQTVIVAYFSPISWLPHRFLAYVSLTVWCNYPSPREANSYCWLFQPNIVTTTQVLSPSQPNNVMWLSLTREANSYCCLFQPNIVTTTQVLSPSQPNNVTWLQTLVFKLILGLIHSTICLHTRYVYTRTYHFLKFTLNNILKQKRFSAKKEATRPDSLLSLCNLQQVQ